MEYDNKTRWELHAFRDRCRLMARDAEEIDAAIQYKDAAVIMSMKRYYAEYYRRYKNDTEGTEYWRAALAKRICDILEGNQETTPNGGK